MKSQMTKHKRQQQRQHKQRSNPVSTSPPQTTLTIPAIINSFANEITNEIINEIINDKSKCFIISANLFLM